MSHRRIIIGDVHGHYDALMHLLEAIAPGKDDQVYFLGDLIDRGPQSAQVVEFVINSGYHCLRGNHEDILIAVVESGQQVAPDLFKAWLYSGGNATLASYGKNIIQNHIEWMKTLPTYLDLGDIWLVHAGLNPNLPLRKQTSEQFCWIRDEFHSMTRPYFVDKLIITGHTITFTLPGVTPGNLAYGAGWLDIDTGAYHRKSGWLTGLDVTHNQVYQFNAKFRNSRKIPLEKAIAPVKPALVLSKRLSMR
ncbi:MAG: serine/threonine protein phosphatase [Moorea sp. SIO2B7]|nr:serine/threonine protein phosphatase [Moorena sp. SIO2B7]